LIDLDLTILSAAGVSCSTASAAAERLNLRYFSTTSGLLQAFFADVILLFNDSTFVELRAF
jgi:hypothetical protein